MPFGHGCKLAADKIFECWQLPVPDLPWHARVNKRSLVTVYLPGLLEVFNLHQLFY